MDPEERTRSGGAHIAPPAAGAACTGGLQAFAPPRREGVWRTAAFSIASFGWKLLGPSSQR